MMGMGTMTVVVEVWPLAADEHGIWLVSGGDALRSPPIGSDSEPHFEVEMLLADHYPILLHSTSWRADGPAMVLTYVAVLPAAGLVLDRYPAACPVPLELLDEVGPPLPHGPTSAPVPRYVDVLHHGLRHLAFLIETNASARDALAGRWTDWLRRARPALAGMYGAKGGT